MEQSIIIVEATSNGRYYVGQARRDGYTPVVVTPHLEQAEEYLAVRAHASEYVNSFSPVVIEEPENFQELFSLIAARNPCCVVAGSEVGVALADKIAYAMGLPGNPPESSHLRRNKNAMQKALKEAGLRYIQSSLVQSVDEALYFAKNLGSWPVVVKPLEGAASVGVHFCHNEHELATHCQSLLSSRDLFGKSNASVLVQEFIHGTEYVVNSISCAGRHQITDVWVYNRVPVGDAGHAYDTARVITRLEPGHHRLISYAFEVLTALEFCYGPSHMELLVDDRGPVLVEVGARPMGGDFPEELLDECLGHHFVDRALVSYCDPAAFSRLVQEGYKPHKTMMIKYFISPEAMQINSAPALPLIAELPSVRRVEYREAMEKRYTPRTVDMITTPGHVLFCHQNEAIILEDYRLIRNIEAQNFSMLFENNCAFTPSLDRDAMTLALSRLVEFQQHADGCLVVIDDAAEAPTLFGVDVIPFASVFALAPDRRYKKIVLHNGNQVTDFCGYCQVVRALVSHLEPGGALYCSPWGQRATVYGSVGIETVFRLLGLRLEPPLNSLVNMLWGRKE